MKMGDVKMSLGTVPTRIRFQTTMEHEIPPDPGHDEQAAPRSALQAAVAEGQGLAGFGAAERAARWLTRKIDERTTQRSHLALLGFSEEQADRFLAITWTAGVDPLPAARYLIQDQGDPSTWKW